MNTAPSPSNNASLRGKTAATPPAPAKRPNRRHTPQDKTAFFEALDRLGTIAAAARELGFNRATCTMWSRTTAQPPGQEYTPAQREEFFVLHDRLNNVANAARQLGINVQTAFNWAYSIKAVTRRPQRALSAREQELKPLREGFLTTLARVGSVTVAAREVGVEPSQGASWARAAGIRNIPRLSGQRDQYLALRREGMPQKTAVAATGAKRKNAARWEQALMPVIDRLDTPNLSSDAYKQEVTTLVCETPALETCLPVLEVRVPDSPASLDPGNLEPALIPEIPLEVLEATNSTRYLSLPERETIRDMLQAGASQRAIARELGRSPSSIGREIKRNSHPVLGYRPYTAQRTSTAQRQRPKPSKLAAPGELRDYVLAKLRKHWSPEQISNLLIKEFPDDPSMRVSHETIYQALYLQARGGLSLEVKSALRTGRTRRKKHKNPRERTERFRDPMVNISERPAEVEDRAVPGHWEGDLIIGAHSGSAIGTLVERTTRYVMLIHLPVDHTAASVRDGLIEAMLTLPEHLRGSLTWDQGSEMAKHLAFSDATDMDVYFCDPHSPWQRGSTENTNGLLRQYFPKSTDLGVYGLEDLEHVAQELNSRPRKTLDWDTPAERLRDLLVTT
ncbi:IS30 family transposase [Paeniglutamicibacter cryotolerans]|uniref:IS30 family transposase n=1 Tax=Paeniglutamicibacter cryotolerans TaxID=670079 RepID=A0A839QM04_9MICC|nr:IS30 family transposase [Paeniglutamicibacter cryotolerans]